MDRRPIRAGLPALALATVLAALPAPVAAAVTLPGVPACSVFPSSNIWNRRVDRLPVRADSDRIVRTIGAGDSLHPDFSSIAGGGYGIPWQVVDGSTPKVRPTFEYADESDPGPYPIPADPRIEDGNDRHLIAVDRDTCTLYELYHAQDEGGGAWSAGSGAIWSLGSNALRPRGWTSADAAGLPILPGLARYDEVAAGAIHHALRFTVPETRAAFIYPARHRTGDQTGRAYPPMGLRFRLKRSVDISGFGPQSRVILRALKRYGMIVADNGTAWYVTGAPDPGWDDDDLHALHALHGSDFEAVDTSGLRNG